MTGSRAERGQRVSASVEHVSPFCPRTEVGEGPLWDPRVGAVLWVGLTEGVVHRWDLREGATRSYPIARPVSGLCLSADGGYLLLLDDHIERVGPDLDGGRVVESPQLPQGHRLNDCGVDADGRLWAGTMPRDLKVAPGGSLFSLRASAEARSGTGQLLEEVSDLGLPNGMDWSPDGATYYLVESARQRVTAFDYDPASGELSAPRVLIEVGPEDGMPDGLTVDAGGDLWLALWGGSAVQRYSPRGELLETHPVPVSQVTSCCFGGPDLDLLFITTAAYRMTPDLLVREPSAGSLFVARPVARGKPPVEFGAQTRGRRPK